MAFTAMENIGPKGGFFVKGNASVYKASNGNWYIRTSASGNCPGADAMGVDISFNGRTDLIVNGKVTQSQSFGLPREVSISEAGFFGFTNMQLPISGSVQLSMTVSYVMTDAGGRAAPVPSMTRIIPIY
jgi:hypothetical protein